MSEILIGWIVGLVACCILACIAIAALMGAPVVEDDQHTPEAPHIPPQIIVHLSFAERMEKREATPEEVEGFAAACREIDNRLADKRLVRNLIRDIEDGK